MALLTLAEAKAQLDYDGDANDAEIQAYIDALTPVIELHTGPVENRTVTETVTGRGPLLALTQVPVVSVTSVTPQLSSGLAVDLSDVVLDPDAGVIRRLDGGSWSGGPWTAVYVAGRGGVPPTINLAARMLLQHLWRTQYGAARGGGGADDFNVNEPVIGYGYAIPNRVLHLLEAFKTPPGFA
ncbi:head-tail connector protein [Streptomyces microflavus]|uniref:head-tail connector protein n=1 Tax=Streptomyces microflavus TaxID=1919 RepID=UPI0035E25DCC